MRKYAKEDLIALLTNAQGGDSWAEEELIMKIREDYGGRVSPYLGKNRQVENDDIRQEFLIGVSIGIKTAKLDIGNPIEFIVTQGIWRVRSYMRKFILQGTFQICKDCGAKSRLNRIGDRYICTRCGSTSVETYEVNDHDEFEFEAIVDTNNIEQEIMDSLLIEEFEKTLTPGTNIHNLYIILKSGIRDDANVKNYIREIAKQWGGCSDSNVLQHMKKLQARLAKFIAKYEEE